MMKDMAQTLDHVHHTLKLRFQPPEYVSTQVHRVGQKKDVRVIRFVTRRTVEERIIQLQNKKRSMIRGAMHHKLTADDVKMLFSTFDD